MVVDTLGYLLAPNVTPAQAQERAPVAELAMEVQALTSGAVELAYVDQGYKGVERATAAEQGITLEVVQLPAAERGFVLLARRWVVERRFAWSTRFRRLARDFERSPATVTGFHFLAFACLMLTRAIKLFGSA